MHWIFTIKESSTSFASLWLAPSFMHVWECLLLPLGQLGCIIFWGHILFPSKFGEHCFHIIWHWVLCWRSLRLTYMLCFLLIMLFFFSWMPKIVLFLLCLHSRLPLSWTPALMSATAVWPCPRRPPPLPRLGPTASYFIPYHLAVNIFKHTEKRREF